MAVAEMAVEAGKVRETDRVTVRTRTTLMALGLFVLALAVRLPGLDTFFTADEFLWVDRSRVFLGGLLSPEFTCLLPNEDKTDVLPGQGLACTLRTGHPGVKLSRQVTKHKEKHTDHHAREAGKPRYG
jgi:hypothetical protein